MQCLHGAAVAAIGCNDDHRDDRRIWSHMMPIKKSSTRYTGLNQLIIYLS